MLPVKAVYDTFATRLHVQGQMVWLCAAQVPNSNSDTVILKALTDPLAVKNNTNKLQIRTQSILPEGTVYFARVCITMQLFNAALHLWLCLFVLLPSASRGSHTNTWYLFCAVQISNTLLGH